MSDTSPETPESLISLLDQLQDVPEPTPISLFPQTVGWLVLLGILLVISGWGAWRWYRTYQANAYRRAALAEITAAENDPATLESILRRAAITAFGREQVAGVHGPAWVAFLRQALPKREFDENLAATLAAAPYRPTEPSADLTQFVQDWIRHHEARV